MGLPPTAPPPGAMPTARPAGNPREREGLFLGIFGLIAQLVAAPFTFIWVPFFLEGSGIFVLYSLNVILTGLVLGILAITRGRAAGKVLGIISVVLALAGLVVNTLVFVQQVVHG